MKSTTIWVSLETKRKADKLKGKKSYNKHYQELMEMYEKGLLKRGKTEITNNLPEKIKEIIHNELVETLSMMGMSPLFYERMRYIVRQELYNILNPKYSYCRNCGYPVISYSMPVQEKKKTKSIFTMLL